MVIALFNAIFKNCGLEFLKLYAWSLFESVERSEVDKHMWYLKVQRPPGRVMYIVALSSLCMNAFSTSNKKDGPRFSSNKH